MANKSSKEQDIVTGEKKRRGRGNEKFKALHTVQVLATVRQKEEERGVAVGGFVPPAWLTDRRLLPKKPPGVEVPEWMREE